MALGLAALMKPLDSLLQLGAEFITDKDKLIEYQFKAMELKQAQALAILNKDTSPWIDGTVKLMMAFQVFWRPFVGAAMTLFGAYAHYKGIEIDAAAHLIFDGAFPAWGASRHVEKQKKLRIQETKQLDQPFSDWGDTDG